VQSKISLARLNGDNISGIRPLSEAEIEEIKSCNMEIFEFNRHFKLIEYVLHNFEALKACINEALHSFAEKQESIGHYDLDKFGHEVNITLLNLMMSAKTFLDHMETNIKREYGKDSEQIKLFKNLTSKEFDDKFSYKFMYKLRNYVQHCGMPPLKYSKSKVFNDGTPYAEIILNFDRDSLLLDFKKWGALVKSELEKQEENFNAFYIIEEFVLSILSIYVTFFSKTTFENTLKAKMRILEIIEQPEPYFSDDYCILKAEQGEGGKATFNMSFIPASLFKKVKQFLDWKNEI